MRKILKTKKNRMPGIIAIMKDIIIIDRTLKMDEVDYHRNFHCPHYDACLVKANK